MLQHTKQNDSQTRTIRIVSATNKESKLQGLVVQSVVSLTSSLKVIPLTVLADLIHNNLIFFCWKNVSSFCTAKAENFSIFAYIVSLDVNFNESLTDDIVSFEQLGPAVYRVQLGYLEFYALNRNILQVLLV